MMIFKRLDLKYGSVKLISCYVLSLVMLIQLSWGISDISNVLKQGSLNTIENVRHIISIVNSDFI